VAWLESVSNEHLHLSAVTMGEIQSGIEITRDGTRKAAEIEAWLDQVAGAYNLLAIDARTFRIWARLMHHKSDRLIEDAIIAATAAVHGLTVVTRHVSDFEGLRVRTFNPFRGRPA
jgi:toxin FitB